MGGSERRAWRWDCSFLEIIDQPSDGGFIKLLHRYMDNKDTENQWRFTGFYRESETLRKIEAWDSLRNLNYIQQIPWLCVGDFNELLRQEEKLGGAVQNHGQMQQFRDVVDECGFIDLGFVGTNFTWSKHFADGHSIWERLDSGLANNRGS